MGIGKWSRAQTKRASHAANSHVCAGTKSLQSKPGWKLDQADEFLETHRLLRARVLKGGVCVCVVVACEHLSHGMSQHQGGWLSRATTHTVLSQVPRYLPVPTVIRCMGVVSLYRAYRSTEQAEQQWVTWGAGLQP